MESARSDRRYLVAAVLVAVFVALYPALDLAGHCDEGGCPDVIQISASSSPDLPATGMLAAAVAPVAVAGLFLGFLLPLLERHPDEVLLSPESPPPRT